MARVGYFQKDFAPSIGRAGRALPACAAPIARKVQGGAGVRFTCKVLANASA